MSSVIRFRPWFFAILFTVPTLVMAQEGKPLAVVNGSPISEADLKVAMEDIGATIPQGTEEQKRKYALDYLVDLRVLAQSAEKQKVADTPEFARKMAYLRERALMEALMVKEATAAVDDAKLKAFYDEALKGMPSEEEARARHILVPTEEEAKAAVAKLNSGADFAKLAEEISKDPGSAKEGGDLGYFTKDRMVKEFADAAFALKPNEVSAPVKSQFGWHIIKLEDKRTKQPPPFDEVKGELTRYLAQKAQQDMILKLRSESKIELAPEFKDKPAETSPPPAKPATSETAPKKK